MTLGKQMTERLRQLTTGGAEAAQLELVEADHKRLAVADTAGRSHATLDLFDYDRYSITLRELTVALDGPADPAAAPAADAVRAALSDQAAAIIRHLSYLEEPLAVWELECSERIAQLRSSPPQREESEVCYWEVTLLMGNRPQATLARYRWAPSLSERELVAYPATFALVARIADSLSAALQQ